MILSANTAEICIRSWTHYYEQCVAALVPAVQIHSEDAGNNTNQGDRKGPRSQKQLHL